MEKSWNLEYLSNWAIQLGLQPKIFGQRRGIMVSPPEQRMPMFRICIDGLPSELSAEIAVNPESVHGIGLEELLGRYYDLSGPEEGNKWPLIRLTDFSPEPLELIAAWARKHVLHPWSPPPQGIGIPDHAPERAKPPLPPPPEPSRTATPAKTPSGPLNKWLGSFLAAKDCDTPDGRPLYAYKTTDDEYHSVSKQLHLVAHFRGSEIFRKDRKFDALFLLFAAEWWRRDYQGDSWSWLPVFKALGLDDGAVATLQSHPQQLLYPALERGFDFWKRDIFTLGGSRTFIGSIAAEGGLPLKLLGDPHAKLQRFFKHLLERYQQVRTAGVPANQIASELRHDLPKSFRQETVFRVAGEIVESTLGLRSQFGLEEQDDPVGHLDQVHPDWRERFPLSLDNQPAQTLLRALMVDAAQSSDSGVPLTLKRRIVSEVDGRFRLQAAIDIGKKVSQTALTGLFGELEWPHQLEIWLLHPFKARLALLTRLDREQFKVRKDGTAWHDGKALEEVRVRLFSYGTPLGEARTLPTSLMEEELPWVFVERDGSLGYLGQGGMSLAAESVTLALPKGMEILSEEDAPERLGELEALEREIFVGTGSLQVRGDEGELSIRTRQPKLEIPQYELVGQRLYRNANMRRVFLGAPKLRCQDAGGQYQWVAAADVQWRHAGHDDVWKPLSGSMEGVIDVRAKDGNELLYRSRVAVLPAQARFDPLSGDDQRSGALTVSGLSGVRFASGSEGIDLEVADPADSPVTLKLTRKDENLSDFPLLIQWPSLARTLELDMPIPVAGARFRGAAGRWLEDRTFISISDLPGIYAIGFNHSGAAPEQFYLDINIRAHDLGVDGLRTLTDRIRLPQMDRQSELPLIHLRDRFQQLFSLSEDLDCRIELTLEGNRRYGRLHLARYTRQLEITDGVVSLRSARYGGVVKQETIEGMELEAHSLLNPKERGQRMMPRKTQDVPTGDWESPTHLNPGPWLILAADRRTASVRPGIMGVPGYVPSGEGRLRDAVAIPIEKDRRERISECLAQMAVQYDHKDWNLVFDTLSAFQQLPATSLDLWDCFARNPDAMAMLLVKAEQSNYQQVLSIADELPFSWELVPYSSWVSAFGLLRGYIEHTAPAGMEEILIGYSVKQRLEYLREADGLLEKTILLLSEKVLEQSDSELKDAELLGLPGIMDQLLGSASADLRNRQGANVLWAEFHGNLLREICAQSPQVTHSLYTRQARYMQAVLHAPVAMAIRAYALPPAARSRLTNTDRYQLQQIRQFDEQWYKEAYSLTLLYLYAQDLLNTENQNEIVP